MDRRQAYRDLLRGNVSRNRAFERFSTREGRLCHKRYRCLLSLLADMGAPGARTTVSRQGAGASAEVCIELLKYSRTVRLHSWEIKFLLEDMGGARHLAKGRPA